MEYTIGEIHRLGLLKSHTGEPYKNKGEISRIVNAHAYSLKRTAWGEGKCLSDEQIKECNKKRVL